MAATATVPVPEAVAPPPGHPRFPLFDSLRAVAMLMVLVVHTATFTAVFGESAPRRLMSHLDMGLTIFFVISGFLMYRPMLATRILGARQTPVRVYARRRVLRIIPGFWFALTALAVFPGIEGVFTGNWWVYYTILQNYPVYTATGGCVQDVYNCGIAPSWSLAIELLFYAGLPLFAVGMARLGRRWRASGWLGPELIVLAIFSAISVWIQASRIDPDVLPFLFFSPLGRAWWLAVGMGLAAISVWVEQRGAAPRGLQWVSDNPAAPWAIAGALYLWMSLFFLRPGPSIAGIDIPLYQYLTEYVVVGLIAALLVLPAVFGDARSGWPRRLLSHPALAWLGLISYGIFLWHFPILFALRRSGVADWWPGHPFPVVVTLTLVITVACASLSYYLVERPLMRLKHARSGTPRWFGPGRPPRAAAE